MANDKLIPQDDLSSARSTVTNWPNQVRTIVDGYRAYSTISHGVQKDAIQNGWDAKVDKRHGKNWAIEFNLIKGKSGNNYLTITDTGTTGLTGRVLCPEDLTEDLPSEEKWGRFENLAFTKTPEEEAIGARGRGKFIFVGASKDLTIFYDTLREDKIYRFGFRTIKLTDSPINSFDNAEGRKKIGQYSKGDLEPLSIIGTRVIIVNPIDELIKDIESGDFLRYIEETWWEIILKFDAKICVVSKEAKKTAKVPKEFRLLEQDTSTIKFWKKDDIKIMAAGQEYRIKHLHFVCNVKNEISENVRGVAIQRSGMKVCSLAIPYVPANIVNGFYGYVSFDRELDIAMQKEEGIEHYSFSWRKSAPLAVKRKIEDEMEKFAREKLGVGVNPEEQRREMQSSAEKEAVYAINRILKKLGLKGLIGGGGGGTGGTTTNTVKKEIRLEITDFIFPRKIRRVNYGESLKGAKIIACNDTKLKIKVQIRSCLVHFNQEMGKPFCDLSVELEPGQKLDIQEFDFEIKKDIFPMPGQYAVKAKMIALDVAGLKKGTEIDKVRKVFYVEEDPPEKGIFEKCEAAPYPKDDEEINFIMGEAISGDDGGYIFQYNINHPAYEGSSDSRDSVKDYLVRIMADEVPRVILRSDNQQVFESDVLNQPERLAREISKLQGKILHNYFTS